MTEKLLNQNKMCDKQPFLPKEYDLLFFLFDLIFLGKWAACFFFEEDRSFKFTFIWIESVFLVVPYNYKEDQINAY